MRQIMSSGAARWIRALAAAAAFSFALPRSAVADVVVLDNGTTASAEVAKKLAARGIAVRTAALSDLATSAGASGSSRSLWIGVHLADTRASEASAVLDHLRAGGGFLVLGESPFQRRLHELGGRWVPEDTYLAHALTPETAIRFGDRTPADFLVLTDHPDAGSTVSMERAVLPRAEEATVAHVRIPELRTWTCLATSAPATMPRGEVTSFWARGTTDTYQLAVEWMEKDFSRWIATVELTPEWRYYTLKPEDFVFWYDTRSRGRGWTGDRLRPENAFQLSIGLALTHTRVESGSHEFWISDVGLAPVTDSRVRELLTLTPVDGLYPRDMTYPVRPARAEVAEAFRQGGGDAPLPLPAEAWSSYWRPMGSGIGKDRRVRFVPVVTACNADGSRAGTLAAIYLHFKEPWPDAVYGYVSVAEDDLLLSDGWMDVAAAMVRRMERRAFLAEAGSTEFTYDVRDLREGRVPVGARTLKMCPAAGGAAPEVRLAVRAGEREVYRRSAPAGADGLVRLSGEVPHDGRSRDTLQVRTELREGDTLLDVVEQEIRFDGPRRPGRFLTAADRQFRLDGRPWRAFGINYMPSSGLALVDKKEFEFWMEDRSYDPDIVEADLRKVAELGFNMISVFIYAESAERGNLLDLLQRARSLGLLVNLSLRPNEPPFPASRDVLTTLVTTFRTAEKDEIMAYDIAWEPWWGGDTQRMMRHAKDWVRWVEEKYGSREGAARAWGFAPDRLEEFPSNDQLRYDGPWRGAVAAYRAFVRETLRKAYGEAREHLRRLDPNHLVSFRQSEGANPLADPAYYPIPLECIADAVDFFSPEAYGIGDSSRSAKTMLFAAAYGQGLAPGKPMIWAEYGKSVWSGNAFAPREPLLRKQAQVYRNVLEYAQQSRAAGTVAWWFAGGYRRYEDSDYGVVNPDGTARPVEAVLRELGERMKSPPPPVTWEPVLSADGGVRGYAGIYEQLRERFEALVTADSIPLVVQSDH